MEDASSTITDQMGTINIDDVDNMEEEEQVKEQVKEVKEVPMTDSDSDSNTYSWMKIKKIPHTGDNESLDPCG